MGGREEWKVPLNYYEQLTNVLIKSQCKCRKHRGYLSYERVKHGEITEFIENITTSSCGYQNLVFTWAGRGIKYCRDICGMDKGKSVRQLATASDI
ncbi:hypothetical protein HOLleu_40719 [Holothuria leucospilota]|uniref:Uncharacterized protein n=1 Tax=Holothuria leucospilota TaxID=206669 RepID=A0A9Q1BBV5_HOLLE|nr:hypothetical protein HOLleu_40719 [Holothuria leucospilota]